MNEPFVPAPSDFVEDVENAAEKGWGGDLSLFAEEAEGFAWAVEGLRQIGHALFQMKRLDLSGMAWGRLREKIPNDLETNLFLGMIFQRLGDFARSDQALLRALKSLDIDGGQRANRPVRRKDEVEPHDWTGVPVPTAAARPHVILFTGHRIDAPGRKKPRFPADREPIARQRIKEKILECLGQIPGGSPRGLAGGASGGDILFLEVCAELGIATDLYLALPPKAFCEASVADSGPEWEKRFYDLVARHPRHRELAGSDVLPGWLRSKPDYDLWSRNNLWMLHNAIEIAGREITLIALWNGEGGDGPGGTEDMVRKVEKLKARVEIIDSKKE